MRVELTYFKDSGKYYTEAAYESAEKYPWAIAEEVRAMRAARRLPGLTENHSWYYVLIKDSVFGFPMLLAKD